MYTQDEFTKGMRSASNKNKKIQTEIEKLAKKYAPKQINQYEENGDMIRVFEKRFAENFVRNKL